MPYIGKQPANVPVTADDIPNDSITAAKIVDAAITIDDIGPNAVGNSEMADDAIGLNELSATGTTNTSTFLRGDNTWAVPPDNNTTYSVQDGQLSQNNFTDADHSKLNAIEASADVTDATNVTAAGALMDSEVTNLAQVKAFDSSDYATSAQGTLATNALPKAGGTMTGDLIASGASTPKLTVKSNDGTSASLKLQRVNENDASTDFEIKNDGGTFKIIGDNSSQNEYESIRLSTTEARIYTNNSERMRIDSSGNVGIGITPTNNLHIKSTGNTDQNFIQVEDSDGNKAMRLLSASSTGDNELIVYNTSGSGKVKLNSNGHSYFDGGNLGIGTTSPNANLHLYNNSDHVRLKVECAQSSGQAWMFQSRNNGEFWIRNDSGSGTNPVVINSSGQIGIGLASGQAPDTDTKLHIKDAGGTSYGLTLNHATNDPGKGFMIHFKGGDTAGNHVSYGLIKNEIITRNAGSQSGAFIFKNAIGGSLTETMRITETGRLLIKRSSAHSTEQVQINHVGASEYGMYINSTSGGTGTQYHMSWARGDTQCGYLTSGPTSVGLNNASDERLKENIQDSASATQSIKNIKVRQFDWKNDIDAHKDYGFVAQELVTVVPEAVAVGSDELNEDGTPVQIWGVDDSKLIPRLVKTIQELEARITALEA